MTVSALNVGTLNSARLILLCSYSVVCVCSRDGGGGGFQLW